ncbi:hypothetical protein DFP74_5086 [Nocardiopsis sp. Huas11]|uniref:hypothetical protein n=1 Tax=Nocardiopsis sp. Huas11 TaxID=2183912 RepID=UPI000EAF57A9|nr:hypothetical protein [Nocardiopsis sp. Huas11]RKS09351.1 hypothetical protein DFP74_5086 [Nocardiopsis sp. Huas11]
MRILQGAGAAACAAVLAMAPVQAAQAGEPVCEQVASARDSTGATLWIETCDPYAVRAGGENLAPGATVVLREAGKGMYLAEATVAEGEDWAVTEYWSGYVGYGEDRPYGHVATVDIGDGNELILRDF